MSFRSLTVSLLSATLVAGCAMDPITRVESGDTAARPVGAAAVETGYGIASGDQLKVSVAGDQQISGTYTVNDGGIVTLPLLGPVPVAGMSPVQAGQAIATALLNGGLFRNPQVTVEVITLRPFYILGEVNKPGQYAYTPGMSLFAAVATAGGYTYRANTGRVFIRKANEQSEREYNLDADIAIMPGDVIRIPERYF